MKRTLCLILALSLVLALAPAVFADVIIEPEDSFYRDHQAQCQYISRVYYADGPDNAAVVYRSPESAAVVERVENGETLWISYRYTAADGIDWGYCEDYEEGWSGWVPMDYLLLKYDSISFREEFAGRITEQAGEVNAEGDVHFWDYPGSSDCTAVQTSPDYLPEYQRVFTDDAGRKWGHVGYYMGIRDVWVCLDAPTADHDTLYAEKPPQQVTHPVSYGAREEIKPAGPGMGLVLAAVCAVAAASGGFLWITRKRK